MAFSGATGGCLHEKKAYPMVMISSRNIKTNFFIFLPVKMAALAAAGKKTEGAAAWLLPIVRLCYLRVPIN